MEERISLLCSAWWSEERVAHIQVIFHIAKKFINAKFHQKIILRNSSGRIFRISLKQNKNEIGNL
jgi:hypothetical protein